MISPLYDWIASRLTPAEIDSHKSSEQRFWQALESNARLTWFLVPVATGLSEALFVCPKNSHFEKHAIALLFHGLGENACFPNFDLIESLLSQGICVLSVTLDGHSLSNKSTLDFAVMTRTIPLIINKLYSYQHKLLNFQEKGMPACYLIGNSIGATLCLIAATRLDVAKVCKAVVAISPIVVPPTFLQQQDFRADLRRPSVFFKDYLSKSRIYGTSFFGRINLARNVLRNKINLKVNVFPIEQLRNFISEIFVGKRVLEHVLLPTLFVKGSADKIVAHEETLNAISTLNSGLFIHEVSDRGHKSVFLSRSTVQYVSNFLSKCIDCGFNT